MASNDAKIARLKKDRKVLLAALQKATRELAEVETDLEAAEAERAKAPAVDPSPKAAPKAKAPAKRK